MRIDIAELHHAGLSFRQIAGRLGQAASTVSRKLHRNAALGGYRPFNAYRKAPTRRGASPQEPRGDQRAVAWGRRSAGQALEPATDLPARGPHHDAVFGLWAAVCAVMASGPAPRLRGRLWCGDVTMVRTSEGPLYPATVIGLYSRRALGYVSSGHHD